MSLYRWTWHTIPANLRWAWWSFWFGCRNVRIFWSAVWHFNTCDYTSLLELIERAARQMRALHTEHPITADAGKVAKRLTVVAELCRRLREDNYFVNAGYDNKWQYRSDSDMTRIVKHAGEMAQNDARYLGQQFRFVQHWWQ